MPDKEGTPELSEIVSRWLLDNGYDGLYNADLDCGCELKDLMPCCQPATSCVAGYKIPCNPEHCEVGGQGCSFHMIDKKEH